MKTEFAEFGSGYRDDLKCSAVQLELRRVGFEGCTEVWLKCHIEAIGKAETLIGRHLLLDKGIETEEVNCNCIADLCLCTFQSALHYKESLPAAKVQGGFLVCGALLGQVCRARQIGSLG